MSVFSHVLLVFNSSTNIIIYSWKDKKFRNLLKRKLNIFHLPVTNTSYMETVQRPGTTVGSRTKRKGTEETVIGGSRAQTPCCPAAPATTGVSRQRMCSSWCEEGTVDVTTQCTCA